MIGRLFKMVAYARSPKMAFGLFHPMKAAKLGAALWVARKVFGSRKRKSTYRPARANEV